MFIKVLGTGSYLPSRVVTNDELAQSLDTSDEWIFSHTGIRSRHIAAAEESTSTMATKAAERALEEANVKAEDIGLIILATSTPDYAPFPATACLVQDNLGCKNSGAFDLQAACSGFVYALEQARGWLSVNPGKKALVIGAETLSRAVDWKDRASCIIFGDGAGAMVLGMEEGDVDFRASSILGSDGSGAHFIHREGGFRKGYSDDAMPISYMAMQGRPVFNFAVKTLDATVSKLCGDAGIKPGDLDYVFAHQANGRILEAVGRRMELPAEKFYMNLSTTGNTSAASIPLAIDEARKKGSLKDGMRICLVGFGAGLTFAGTLMKWPNL